ncbi:MAG TPA: dihydrolipoamide acetyltransferase family protein, partial [Williamwhitmania sp.]|nr:dihydrolipoamide acetyltransferase family protein [Williamwhitmania sp.]
MSQFELKMPKMGESVEQATITRWFVKEGDKVEEDDALLEIATDKVDSEIPSPVEGTVIKVFYRQDDLVPVGTTIALIGTGGEVEVDSKEEVAQAVQTKVETTKQQEQLASSDIQPTRFYSPLVKSIAKQEHISVRELEQISGSGKDGRVRKEDILAFLSSRSKVPDSVLKAADSMPSTSQAAAPAAEQQQYRVSVSVGAEDTIIVMDRMRKLIAEHMVTSKHVAAHVTAMVEADVTGLVEWRDKNKEQFQKRYGEKLTFMPMFTDAVAKSLRDFPMVNSSLDGDKIILRKHVNIGIAVALPSGNLIVPVVQDADLKNLAGLAADI